MGRKMTKLKSKVEDAKAETVKADLLWGAWRDFVSWAIGEPDILFRYERATGRKIMGVVLATVKRDPRWWELLEQEWVLDFIIWVTQTYWGEADAPPEYHSLVARRR
jgi:hypothetical protein